MFAQAGLHGDFLKLKETRALFRSEQHFPSCVIERGGPRSGDAYDRARERAAELLDTYTRPQLSAEREEALLAFARHHAKKAGVDSLPAIECHEARIG